MERSVRPRCAVGFFWFLLFLYYAFLASLYEYSIVPTAFTDARFLHSGSNPAVTRKGVEPGRSYYDTVGADSPNTLTTWQQVLRSEEMRRYNFSDLVE